MTDHETAADHLRIIRSLMERATVYRAISAPAALFGGIVALLVGIVMARQATPGLPSRDFFCVWVGVLALVGLFNTVLLWRGSQKRGEKFFSSGMKLALRATVPPMLAGGVISFLLVEGGAPRAVCALLWVIFYSLALLAAGSFAPRSMRWLGWMFFCAGLGLLTLRHLTSGRLGEQFSSDQVQAGIIMALTFGALHILYALIILCRPPKGEEV